MPTPVDPWLPGLVASEESSGCRSTNGGAVHRTAVAFELLRPAADLRRRSSSAAGPVTCFPPAVNAAQECVRRPIRGTTMACCPSGLANQVDK